MFKGLNIVFSQIQCTYSLRTEKLSQHFLCRLLSPLLSTEGESIIKVTEYTTSFTLFIILQPNIRNSLKRITYTVII